LKLYRFNNQTLQYDRLHAYPYVVGAICLMVLMSISRSRNRPDSRESDLVVLESEIDAFSEDKLMDEIKRSGIKFADIVFAQAVLETGYFKSEIFQESNNLFGMKLARQRNTTASGESRGHAYYDDWRLSVMDYSLYQTTYLRKIKTERQYLQYLSENYAEDPNYVNKLIKIKNERQQ
jgi:hypothetical protein